jgi:hypothetical protein
MTEIIAQYELFIVDGIASRLTVAIDRTAGDFDYCGSLREYQVGEIISTPRKFDRALRRAAAMRCMALGQQKRPHPSGAAPRAFIDSSPRLAIIDVLMAMRPTRPPRKRGPILYGQQYAPLHILKDTTIHTVQPSQKSFGADEPDLRYDRGECFAVVLEKGVIRIPLGP